MVKYIHNVNKNSRYFNTYVDTNNTMCPKCGQHNFNMHKTLYLQYDAANWDIPYETNHKIN